MGRKKAEPQQQETEALAVPCRRCQTALQQTSPDSIFVCDYCTLSIPPGTFSFNCPQCGFSLCEKCHKKKQDEGKEEAEYNAKYAQYIVPDGQIHPEVWAFCEEFQIEDRLVKSLNEEMSLHHETWEEDMEQMYRDMRHAKGSRSGLLCMIMKQMRDGIWVGALPPDPKIAKVIREYRLDRDARERLTNFCQKREKRGEDWEKDLWEVEQRLMTAKNTSAMALTVCTLIAQGKELPAIRPVKKDAGKEYDRRHGHRDRDRDRDRDRSRSRSRRRERYASRSRSRSRDRGKNRRPVDDSQMAEIEAFCNAKAGTYKQTRRVQPAQAPSSSVLQGAWGAANNAGARIREEKDHSAAFVEPAPRENEILVSQTTKAIPKFAAWRIGPSTTLAPKPAWLNPK
eukprot:gnl/MRDRNA2_/MRDRNA2_83231_c0_seq4.p1 gnl/MRDRNA2_/MRDRNA2_83231_c0~~gnl/MRDRNA2_/MRDRNA2_83231_c0_seq4.p1  ORF type:complete len:398 (-),score=74.20 gnl/MRDRNA2_/MRDRNA2_83231_c0_seq4:181-1374(-)